MSQAEQTTELTSKRFLFLWLCYCFLQFPQTEESAHISKVNKHRHECFYPSQHYNEHLHPLCRLLTKPGIDHRHVFFKIWYISDDKPISPSLWMNFKASSSPNDLTSSILPSSASIGYSIFSKKFTEKVLKGSIFLESCNFR